MADMPLAELACTDCQHQATISPDHAWVTADGVTGFLHFECGVCGDHQMRELGQALSLEFIHAGLPTAPPLPPLTLAECDAFTDALDTDLFDEMLADWLDGI